MRAQREITYFPLQPDHLKRDDVETAIMYRGVIKNVSQALITSHVACQEAGWQFTAKIMAAVSRSNQIVEDALAEAMSYE